MSMAIDLLNNSKVRRCNGQTTIKVSILVKNQILQFQRLLINVRLVCTNFDIDNNSP